MNLSTLGCSRHRMTFTWRGEGRLGLGLHPSLSLPLLPRQRSQPIPQGARVAPATLQDARAPLSLLPGYFLFFRCVGGASHPPGTPGHPCQWRRGGGHGMSQESGEGEGAVLLTDLLEECPLCLFVKPDQLLHHHHLARLPVRHLRGDTEARSLGTDGGPSPTPRTARGTGRWLQTLHRHFVWCLINSLIDENTDALRFPDSGQGHPAGRRGWLGLGGQDRLTQRLALSSALLGCFLEVRWDFSPGKGTRDRASPAPSV